MRTFETIVCLFALLFTACGKSPLKSTTQTGTQGTATTQTREIAWGSWDPKIVVADNTGRALTQSGADEFHSVATGENYNFDIPAQASFSGLSYQFILFPGSELIRNQNCPASQTAEFNSDIKACVSFNQPTTTPVAIALVFTGPYGTKVKNIFFMVRAKDTPTLVLGTVKPVISTRYLAVDVEHEMIPVNTQGEFRIKAVYNSKEIQNPSVTPAATITRVGDEFVVRTPNPGNYTFSASWMDSMGVTSTVTKVVSVMAERRYQAGEPGHHGISSSDEGGTITCVSDEDATVEITTDEPVDASHILTLTASQPQTTPEILRKNSLASTKYLFFNFKMSAQAVASTTCRLTVKNAVFLLE